MTSRKRQQNMEKKKTDYAVQSPKELNDESVDDMLANVDTFIEGVYRDLSISPPSRNSLGNNNTFQTRISHYRDSSVSSPNTSPDGASSLLNASFANKTAPVVSPTTRRNMDAEIERINQICDNVDQNLRSIGLYMNNSSDRSASEDVLNSNLTSSPNASTSYVSSHGSPPLPTIVRNYNLQMGHQRRRSSPIGSISAHVIDLSESQPQTPEVPRQRVLQNNIQFDDDDDDVILVSDFHPVVDLCTPGGHQEESNTRTSRNQRKLNRRRLNQQDEGETCCQAGPTSTRKRRTEYFTPPEHSNKASESSNVDTSPSAASGPTPFMCPVCMESCLQRQPTSTRCGHVFCKECIERAIRLTHKCPMCNSKISRNQIFRIYL